MNIATITETATSPSSAVPVTAIVGVGNLSGWTGVLPTVINVMTAVYLFLLITHKAYIFYREWKGKQRIQDE